MASASTIDEVEKAHEFLLGKKLEHLKIHLSDIKLATNNFSEVYTIASRDAYTLYRAELHCFDKENPSPDKGRNKGEHLKRRTTVIIKRYHSGHKTYREEAFFTEMEILTSAKHPNIVTLLGFCVEASEMILVIENVYNGYLGNYLENVNGMRILTWEKRLKICIDVAHALNYIHSLMEDQKRIINRDINCHNIGLDENLGAKIVDFGLSVFLPPNHEDKALDLDMIYGTNFYIDPEYVRTGKLQRESDVYSFGVVLFEIVFGRLASDPIFLKVSDKGLAHVARRSFNMGTLEDLIDPIIKEETSENNFFLTRGPNKDSLHTFIEIAYKCLAETQDHRPTMKFVVNELEKALFFQKYHKDNPRISLEDVKVATQNFHDDNLIGRGGFGNVYKGKLLDGDGFKTIAIKRLDRRFDQGEQQFLSELQVLLEYKHENVISLVGYCNENDEKIIVCEYASRGSLDRYLNDVCLTWVKRLHICIEVASALDFLHGGVGKQARLIHRDIKTANILLNRDWKAKLSDFGLSIICYQEADYIIDYACGTPGYLDPLYKKSGFLTIESDIYSFGVVLFEILCGRSTFATHKHERHYLPDFIRKKFEAGKHDDVVFEQIREQMDPKSLATFQKIAYQCLHVERENRPTIKEVLTQLKNALELQTYKSVAHLEIRLKKIASATNNFADENLIREGGFGKDYKGHMLISGQLIVICARRLNRKYGLGDIEFWTEISMHSSLEHKNIISFVGFCDEDEEKIIVYEHAVNGSLDQHLSAPNLTWFQRLKICVGVARAMKYLHYDVIHCDINSSKIFLDKDWEPKIFGFELSTEYPQSWRHRLLFSRHFDNTNMTPKYDIYSFGVLLFELVCGKKPMINGDDSVTKQLDDIIVPTLQKKMDKQSLTVFTNIIYKCLNHQFVQLLTMDRILKELQRMLKLQGKQENLVHLSVVEEDATPLKARLKTEWLKIPLTEIMRATDNFEEKHSVGHGAFGVVYKATLDVLEIQNFSSVEGRYQDKLLKKSKTVAIKRILNRQDEHGKEGFLTEIELLTSCKHRNVVSLVGFCREGREMILVYEYALKGSLNDYFGNHCKMINLTWAQRIQICLDIAHGINYLHTNMEDKPKIIHRDIKSGNILLDEHLTAKVADFGLSKFHPKDQQASTMYSENAVGTKVYTDPEYLTTCKYKKESDVYSFGVVLFEILCGRVAYDSIYLAENVNGLAPIARRHFSEGTLKDLIDPKMIEEDDKSIFTLNRGPNQDSFDVFTRIAYQCVAEIQDKRPTMEVVIKELDRALKLHGETVVLTRFQLRDILSATDNFSELYRIGMHEYGTVYKADLYDYVDKSSLAFEEKDRGKTCITVAIKRISSSGDEKQRFFSEIEMHTTRKHSNIASLRGFCDEGDEMILVFEHGSNRSLDDYLKNADNMDKFKWTQRLHVCLGIAHGLNHLHTKMDRQERIIQRDIRTDNILLGKNWEPKISYFGISNFHLANQKESSLISTQVYWDPEFERRRIMKRKTDIYSFGVILFKIFCGELAYDPVYLVENDKELLTPKARNHFNDGTIKKLLDPKLKEATHDDDTFTSIRGPNQDSLDTFLKIARQCLEEAQAQRPTMEIVIKELEMALNFQENLMERLQLSLKDIKMATDHFSQKNLVGRGIYWDAYKGKLSLADASTTIVAKRWGSKFDDQFWTELDILSKRKHKNIIGLVGYSNEMNEKVTVYEYMSKGSLDKCLRDSNLKWMKRLGICIDVASALEFLHGGDVTLQMVVHRNIKSHTILLNEVWDAKISNFELSSIDSLNQVMEHIDDDAYLEPQYKHSLLTEKSDIYSFGVVLFEILCGRLAWIDGFENNSQSLVPLAKHYYEQGKLIEMVFKDIRKQIGSESLTTFADIAYQCLNEDGSKRPEASEVVIQLKKALELQEDYEIWEPKLPTDYKEIIQSISKHSDINNSLETKKDIYDMFTKGILLQDSKVLFSLGSKGERNEMVSARMFSRKNHTPHKWLSVPESRFPKALKMHDTSNLKIQIKIRTQFLPSCANCKVVIIFRFSSPTKSQAKRIYVNLKYKMGNETMHAYFATWREDGWMTIELFRFLNHKKDTDFEVLLESFSRCYCGRHSVYIEGIQFQEIDNVKHEEIRKSKEVQQVIKSKSKTNKLSSSKVKVKKDHMTWFSLSEIKRKKNEMLSAKKVVYNSSYVAIQSRFSGAIEFLQQQVFRIKCRIKSQLLFANKENVCYLVFKLSDKCCGLHGPVIVRDLFHWRSKETRTLYFRSPNLWNLHDNHWVAKRRKDGWMEVILWKFNSNYKVKNDHLCVHLKLVTYEGTMAGLIVRNLEFR